MYPRIFSTGLNLTRISHLHQHLKTNARLRSTLLIVGTALACLPMAAQYSQYPSGVGYGYGSRAQPTPMQPSYPQSRSSYSQQQAPEYGQAGEGYAYGTIPGSRQSPTYAENDSYPVEGLDYGPDVSRPMPSPSQAPLSPDQLQQMVAPIALYPDALLAQILAASTYPAQVAVADQWLHQMQAEGFGTPEQIAAGADTQNWDPSVKALTAFPQVMDMLNQNLQWTTQLGDAYYNQPQDVMQTVQVMRQRAEQAGTLESSPQQNVTEDQGEIEVAPTNPENVYVPLNDPWNSYGDQVSPYPGFSALSTIASFLGGGPLQDAIGFATSAFMNTPWGWLGWGLDWLSHAILFDHSNYFTHSGSVADWGFPHGGPRAYGGWDRGGREYGDRGYAWDTRTRARAGYGTGYLSDRSSARNWPSSPQPYPGNGWNRSAGNYLPGQRYGGLNPGLQLPQRSYARHASPPQVAYNRPMPLAPRPQPYSSYSYSRPSNGYSFATQPGRNYAQPGYGSYRAPQTNNQRSAGESERSFVQPGRSFSQPSRSGGFHLFGGGQKDSRSFGGSAPKSSFGGGRSSWGFSGGGSKAPKMSGGGGHSFGGGRSSGGGHSGGGSHSGGGKRR